MNIIEYKEIIMSKTITMRLDDDIYNMLKKAADGEKRNISNFIEYAAISFLSKEAFASDEEMNEILNDKQLIKNLKNSEKDIKEGKYRIV